VKGIPAEGVIVGCYADCKCSVELAPGVTIKAYIAGKLVRHRVICVPGDRVALELCMYDPSKGRIVKRL
jgi:translation initiation factor IF-1